LVLVCLLFAVAVFIQRSLDLDWPLAWMGAAAGVMGVAAAAVWAWAGRASAETAAVKLDEAAGLRERLSSGQYCLSSEDPFAQAVVADAERISASVSARQHIRLHPPRRLPLTIGSFFLAAAMFLVSPGWLKPEQKVQAEREAVRVEQTQQAVKRNLDEIRRLAETTPALEDLKDKLDGLDKQAGGTIQRPEDIRHEAVKKIDNLADAVKQRRDRTEYDALRELRRTLRAVKAPDSKDAATEKLTQALSKGDFKTAKDEMKNLKEQLAKLKEEGDKEAADRVAEQLAKLAQQIDQAAKQEEKSKKALEEAGIKKEDAERMLDSLAKKDLEQLKKELAEKGLNQQQIEKLAKQLAQNQKAGEMAKQLAQNMRQGSKAAQSDQAGEALGELSLAAEQLGELEQLEQEMNQLESALAALENAKGGLGEGNKPGEGEGEKPGQSGMGKRGQGRGGRAPEEETNVGFKTQRGEVHTGRGAIVGQLRVDGEQIEGEVETSVSEVVAAAEREASDRVERDRIPRQYQSAVKAYFSNVRRSIRELQPQPNDPPAPSTGDAAGE